MSEYLSACLECGHKNQLDDMALGLGAEFMRCSSCGNAYPTGDEVIAATSDDDATAKRCFSDRQTCRRAAFLVASCMGVGGIVLIAKIMGAESLALGMICSGLVAAITVPFLPQSLSRLVGAATVPMAVSAVVAGFAVLWLTDGRVPLPSDAASGANGNSSDVAVGADDGRPPRSTWDVTTSSVPRVDIPISQLETARHRDFDVATLKQDENRDSLVCSALRSGAKMCRSTPQFTAPGIKQFGASVVTERWPKERQPYMIGIMIDSPSSLRATQWQSQAMKGGLLIMMLSTLRNNHPRLSADEVSQTVARLIKVGEVKVGPWGYEYDPSGAMMMFAAQRNN